MAGRLRVTLRKSPISYTAKTRGTVRAMGLRRIGQTIELPDNPATRGMARAVRFLVEVEEVPAARPAAAARTAAAARSAPGAAPEDETSGAEETT
jgi:large subunit ribosomal protein L30